jgi:hypothetical protein
MRRSMITPKETNSLDVALVVISVILCPSQLFFGYCMDCDVIGRGYFIMYSIIGILNAALYADWVPNFQVAEQGKLSRQRAEATDQHPRELMVRSDNSSLVLSLIIIDSRSYGWPCHRRDTACRRADCLPVRSWIL